MTPGPREVLADPFVDRTRGGAHGAVNAESGTKVTGVGGGVSVNYQSETRTDLRTDQDLPEDSGKL